MYIYINAYVCIHTYIHYINTQIECRNMRKIIGKLKNLALGELHKN